jgi:hypothetical protein
MRGKLFQRNMIPIFSELYIVEDDVLTVRQGRDQAKPERGHQEGHAQCGEGHHMSLEYFIH